MNNFKNFTLFELVYSKTAEDNEIYNIPNFEEVMNLYNLIKYVIQPLRDWYGNSIRVNSGFRSFKLNEKLKGSKTSDHMKGFAVDITAGSKTENKKLFDYIKNNFQFKQLINESNYSWVHVSFDINNNKKEILAL